MTTDICYDKLCKSRCITEGFHLIYIRWNDASHQSGPLYLAELNSDIEIETGGLLVQETDTHYSVAGDYFEKDGTWRHVTHIPKGMVVSVQKFSIALEKRESENNII